MRDRGEGTYVIMLNASYIVGLTEGEGCFLVSLRKDNRIDLRFFITQAEGNKSLLLKVQQFMKVGTVYQKSTRFGRIPAWVYEVTKKDDIYNVIIPFFQENQLLGYKAKSFRAFLQISKIVQGRQDIRKLTVNEYKFVTDLKFNMNKHYGSPDAGNPLVGSLDRN